MASMTYTVDVRVRLRWPFRLILWAAPLLRHVPLVRDVAAWVAMRSVKVEVANGS